MIKRLIFSILIAGGAVLALMLVLYILPRSTGDRFVEALRVIDVSGMEATLCQDTSLSVVMGALAEGGNQAGALLAQLAGANIDLPGRVSLGRSLQPQTHYNPLSSTYRASFRLGSDVDLLGFRLGGGLSTPEITLIIERGSLLRPCITMP